MKLCGTCKSFFNPLFSKYPNRLLEKTLKILPEALRGIRKFFPMLFFRNLQIANLKVPQDFSLKPQGRFWKFFKAFFFHNPEALRGLEKLFWNALFSKSSNRSLEKQAKSQIPGNFTCDWSSLYIFPIPKSLIVPRKQVKKMMESGPCRRFITTWRSMQLARSCVSKFLCDCWSVDSRFDKLVLNSLNVYTRENITETGIVIASFDEQTSRVLTNSRKTQAGVYCRTL